MLVDSTIWLNCVLEFFYYYYHHHHHHHHHDSNINNKTTSLQPGRHFKMFNSIDFSINRFTFLSVVRVLTSHSYSVWKRHINSKLWWLQCIMLMILVNPSGHFIIQFYTQSKITLWKILDSSAALNRGYWRKYSGTNLLAWRRGTQHCTKFQEEQITNFIKTCSRCLNIKRMLNFL